MAVILATDGRLEVDSRRAGGTTVRARFPCPAPGGDAGRVAVGDRAGG